MDDDTTDAAYSAQELNEQERSENEMNVFKCMSAVMADIAKIGVAKNQRNTQQGFMYRGVDDVMNALAPILARHELLVVPSVIERTVTERQSKSGGALFHVLLRVRFSFIAAEDGSHHDIELIGEAMDSGDKATNKALAIAYKYACFQAFCIPLEGVDPDAEVHEPVGEVSADQARRLQVLADEVQADVRRFCSYLKVGSLAELPASRYEEAVKALEAKRKVAA